MRTRQRRGNLPKGPWHCSAKRKILKNPSNPCQSMLQTDPLPVLPRKENRMKVFKWHNFCITFRRMINFKLRKTSFMLRSQHSMCILNLLNGESSFLQVKIRWRRKWLQSNPVSTPIGNTWSLLQVWNLCSARCQVAGSSIVVELVIEVRCNTCFLRLA